MKLHAVSNMTDDPFTEDEKEQAALLILNRKLDALAEAFVEQAAHISVLHAGNHHDENFGVANTAWNNIRQRLFKGLTLNEQIHNRILQKTETTVRKLK